MNAKSIDITILCKVVDNFGDIGVTWRLARHLNSYLDGGRKGNTNLNAVQSSSHPNKMDEHTYQDGETPAGDLSSYRAARLRFVCDDLVSFSKINDTIDPEKSFQECGGVEIYNWNDFDFCCDEFTKNPPEIILECFQCGRPDWMEKILFDDQKCAQGIWKTANRIVNIIMIDYLSAEKYQEDFHCLKSLTRSAKVQKVNFMPGFTKRTGGLLLPLACPNVETPTEPKSSYGAVSHPNTKPPTEHLFSQGATCPKRVLFFAYKNDWTQTVRAMNKVFPPDTEVLIAAGQGQSSIIEACKSCNVAFRATPLDFMNQPAWDNLMRFCDFLFVRGEDSLAQACLCGVPFIWQAYPQSEEYQSVKVKALLERMKPHFGKEFRFVENAWMAINKNFASPAPAQADSDTAELKKKSSSQSHQSQTIESAIYDFLSHADTLRQGFSSFAKSLYENGDLASNLMTFILKNIIIDK